MSGTFIATTPKASVHALAYQGIMVYSSYPQIRDMLRNKFGDEYVLLFAEPIENKLAGEIDWYTPVYGAVQTLQTLPDGEREAAKDKIVKTAQDIKAFAEELIHSPDPLKVTRGHILRLAVMYPDDSYIYVVGEQPVLICWGFGPGTPGVEPKDLTRLALPKPFVAPAANTATAQPVQPDNQEENQEQKKAAAAPVAGRGGFFWGWLWWLLPLLAAFLLFLLLFTSFGGMPPLAGMTLFNGPRLAFLADPPSRGTEITSLENEISDLRLQLERHLALCVQETPPATSPGGVAVVEPERLTPDERNKAHEGLIIPEKTEDTSFLEGQWLCDTGLVNLRTREPVEVLFSFGPNGHGQATTFEKNDKCVGTAVAEMHNGELRINVEEQRCVKSGDSYNPMSIVCKNAEGRSTLCTGVNPNGHTWSADFKRIK